MYSNIILIQFKPFVRVIKEFYYSLYAHSDSQMNNTLQVLKFWKIFFISQTEVSRKKGFDILDRWINRWKDIKYFLSQEARLSVLTVYVRGT